MQNLQSLTRNQIGGGSSSIPTLGPAYMNLPGAAADYASTPDVAALDLTTGIDIIACVALTDWTPAAANTILGKYDTAGNQRAYRLEVLGTGNLALGLSELGTAASTANSGAATGFADGSIHWLRATWRASDGRVQFFTSNDPPGAVPTNWVQLGANQAIAIAGIFDSSANLRIGRQTTAGTPLPMTGRNYRTILKDAIDGTTVADFNPVGHVGATSWTDGVTWTINGAATIRT